jgi:hypothetical protein
MSIHSGDSASNHSTDEDEDTAEITFKPQVSDESNVLEGEGTPAGIEEVQGIKGMSPKTLTVYLEYRERLLERQQRVQMDKLHLKLRHEQELELKKKMEFQLNLEKLKIEKGQTHLK